jgi:HprK-related kinase B
MKPDLPTLKDLARQYLTGKAASHGLTLRMGPCRLRLHSDSPALVHTLKRYFGDFLEPQEDAPVDATVIALEAPAPELGLTFTEKEPEPGKNKIKEEYFDLPGGRVVRKRLTGMVFMFGGDLNLALGPCLANDNQVINFINSRYIQLMLERGHLLCHAAAVAGPQGGLALAGWSGAGKSTLALHMMGLGLDFVSNDRLLIHLDPSTGDLHMHGVAKLPRINPGTALSTPHLGGILSPDESRRFAALPLAELWSLEHKYDVYLDRCFGPGRFRLQAPMLGLVVLTWRHGAGPFRLREAAPGRRAELLEAFVKSPGLFYLPPRLAPAMATTGAYLRDLAGCPVYELAGGADFSAAARACRELLPRAGQAAGCRR